MSISSYPVIIFAAIHLLAVQTSFAQRGPSCSLAVAKYRSFELGAGPSLVSILDNDPDLEPLPKTSFAVDAGFGYMITENLSFMTHLMFEQKGGNRLHIPGSIDRPDVRYTTSSSFLTFSPGLRQYLGKSNIFVEAGPFIGFLFASTSYREVDGVQRRIPNEFATIDIGASGSIGCTPMRRKFQGMTFRVVNNLGLTDANIKTGTKELTNALSFIVAMRIQSRHRAYY